MKQKFSDRMTSITENVKPFVVAGCSAVTASCCVHPIDLAKVRLQLYSTLNPGKKKPGFVKIISDMIKTSGVRSIYSGLSASILRQSIYGTARIGLHRTFSAKLVERNNGNALPVYLKALSSMSSGCLAVCLGTPMDVTLVRMQADSMKEPAKRRG